MKHFGTTRETYKGAALDHLHPTQDVNQTLAELVVRLSSIQSLISGQAVFRRAFAGKVFSIRRARSRFFPQELFAEPAWDILLLLYGVEPSQERLSISAVCASVDSPPTTVLRWIEKLEEAGLLVRQKHPTDRRVNWLKLSDDCVDRLDRFFDSALSIQVAPGLGKPALHS